MGIRSAFVVGGQTKQKAVILGLRVSRRRRLPQVRRTVPTLVNGIAPAPIRGGVAAEVADAEIATRRENASANANATEIGTEIEERGRETEDRDERSGTRDHLIGATRDVIMMTDGAISGTTIVTDPIHGPRDVTLDVTLTGKEGAETGRGAAAGAVTAVSIHPP